jgi:type II secretory pathway pseudopilin PulG
MDPRHKQLTPPKTQVRVGSPSGPKLQAAQPPSPFHIPHSPFPKATPSRLRAFAGNPSAIRHPSSVLGGFASSRSPISDLRSPGAQRPSALRPPLSVLGRRAASAFTLIESIVAIGLFAFVIVGIIGLFGSALERQRQASFETRAVMISQQILARIRAASSATNVVFTTGSATNDQSKFFYSNNFLQNSSTQAVFYYKKDGTEISGVLQPNSYGSSTFSFAGNRTDSQTNDIVGRARVTFSLSGNTNADPLIPTNLHQVTIEVSEPANIPLTSGTNQTSTNFLRKYRATFTTHATFPN